MKAETKLYKEAAPWQFKFSKRSHKSVLKSLKEEVATATV